MRRLALSTKNADLTVGVVLFRLAGCLASIISQANGPRPHLALTVILRGLTASALGMVKVSTPCLNSADTLSL
jgi:hypothetical protein